MFIYYKIKSNNFNIYIFSIYIYTVCVCIYTCMINIHSTHIKAFILDVINHLIALDYIYTGFLT